MIYKILHRKLKIEQHKSPLKPVAFLLTATLYQGNHDRNHKLSTIFIDIFADMFKPYYCLDKEKVSWQFISVRSNQTRRRHLPVSSHYGAFQNGDRLKGSRGYQFYIFISRCNTAKPGNQSERMYEKVVRKYKMNSYIVR